MRDAEEGLSRLPAVEGMICGASPRIDGAGSIPQANLNQHGVWTERRGVADRLGAGGRLVHGWMTNQVNRQKEPQRLPMAATTTPTFDPTAVCLGQRAPEILRLVRAARPAIQGDLRIGTEWSGPIHDAPREVRRDDLRGRYSLFHPLLER